VVSSDLDRSFIALWNELLDAGSAEPPPHFFRAGGDSLGALTLQLRVQRGLGVSLPTRFIFEHPTCHEILEEVRRLVAVREWTAPPPPATEPGAPSDPERSQLIIDWFRPGGNSYLECFAFRVRGPLDAARLRRCVDALVRRHPALRTTFSLNPGDTFVRVEHADLPAEFVAADLRAVPTADRDGAAEAWLREQAQRPMDLRCGPLVRIALASCGDEDFRLLLVIHHIAIDEWSLRILFQELAQLYESDGGAPLPDAAPGAAAPGSERTVERDVGWWLDHLRGAAIGSGRALRTVRGPARVHRFDLDAALARALRDQAAQRGVTTYLLLLTGYAALLARVTGREEVLLGTPVSLRDRPEVERTVGMFVQVLPMRIDASGTPSFVELLERVRREFVALLEHRHAPFDRIVSALSSCRADIFSSVFVYHDRPLPVPVFAGTRTEPVAFAAGSAKWDRLWTVAATADGFKCVIESDLDVTNGHGDDLLGERFSTLLRALLRAPGEPISAHELLGEREARALATFERGAAYECRATVHGTFAERALEHPDRIAVQMGPVALDYRTLDRWSDRVAQQLRDRGVSVGDVVAVGLPRSPEAIVAILATLKAGAAYVPLEPGDPPERLRELLEAAAPRLVFARSDGEERFGKRALLTVEPFDPSPAEPPPAPALDGGARAYIMFTSGSTGRPKPVEVPHRGVVRLVRGGDRLALGPDTVFLHHSPGNFDASTLEIWGPLLNGGTVVLLPPGPPDLLEMKRAIDRGGVTALWLTAALFHLIVDELPALFERPRRVLTGGDVVSGEHVARLLSAYPDLTVVNGYGPTENTTFTTCRVMTRADVGAGGLTRPASIGRPIAGTTVRILDPLGRRVPIGTPGELYCGGAGLARGYYQRPELTAEWFVPDLFEAGATLYRTGDLACWAADGTIEFLGRADSQIKISGYRIEPGEIESVLCLHPGVLRAVVTARGAGPAGKHLVAHVVGSSDRPTARALRDFAQRKLPGYMVPARIVFLDRLPLTANGKVDCTALPEPGRDDPPEPPEPEAIPGTEEHLLTRLWRELLGLDRVGANENFFDLGGNSLLGLQLGLRIEQTFGVKLPLTALASAPTVAALAEVLRRPHTGPDPLVPLEPSGTGPPLFLIAGLGGHGISLRPLAKLLTGGRPVYALQPPGFIDTTAPRVPIEVVARDLIGAMRRAAPTGPYYLGGYSAGALVAYEMARHLRRSGERVALLALIDAHGPGYPRMAPRLVRAALRLRRLMRDGVVNGLWRALRRDRPVPARAAGPTDIEAGIRQAFATSSPWWREVLKAYPFQPFDGPMVVFRASEVPERIGADYSDPLLGWGGLARGGLTVHTVPGSHLSMIKPPGVAHLAALLSESLRSPPCAPEAGTPDHT
jgi:amino acid adenylation domain-containing protein